jgi:hypothetical protein
MFRPAVAMAVLLMAARVTAQAWAAAVPPSTWLRISAFTDQPLAGADVTVLDTDGQLLFAQSDATNDRGIYPAKVANLPQNFRVIVSGDLNAQANPSRFPSLGRVLLSADVRNYNPVNDVVYVNPATTLVTGLLRLHSEMDLSEARAQVRHFLAMPANASLGDALRETGQFHSAYFSESAFLTEANEHGGIIAYTDRLDHEILYRPNAVHPFPFSSTSQNAIIGGIAKFVGKELASGALSWALGHGMGWVAESAGLITPGATAEQIEQLQQSLDSLQSSVDQLKRQMELATQQILNELTKTQYHVTATQAIALASDVNVVSQNLNYYVEGCPPLPEDGGTVTVGSVPADWCSSQGALIRSQLSDIQINGSFERLASWLLDSPAVGYKGMIRLFSQSAGQTVTRFYRPADSMRVQNMFDYWQDVETQAADLKVELWHLNGAQNNPGGVRQLTDFLGNAQLSPPTTGSFQATLGAEQMLMFPPVPVGTVVDTLTRLMWLTDVPKRFPSGQCPFGDPTNQGYGLTNGPSFGFNYNGLNFISPSQSQLLGLIYGWSGATPMAWLVDQSKAVAPDSPISNGFFNVFQCNLDGIFNYNYVWTSTDQGSGGPNYSPYALVDMSTGMVLPKNTTTYKLSNWLMLTRPLAQGEQYYWYP